MKTRQQALRDLGRVVAEAYAVTAHLTAREAAERAWHPGGPPVNELAAQIQTDRDAAARGVDGGRRGVHAEALSTSGPAGSSRGT